MSSAESAGPKGEPSFAEAILEASADGIVVVDEEGSVVRMNPAAELLLGRGAGEMGGRPFGIAATEVTDEGAPLQIVRPDGSLRSVELRRADTRWKGRPVTVLSLRDVTDRLAAAAKQARLEEIIEATPSLVGIATADGRIEFVNHGGRKLLDLGDTDPVEDLEIWELHPPETARMLRDQAIPTALEEGIWSGETRILGRGDEEIPIWQTILVHPAPPEPVRFLSTIGQDLRRWREAEAALEERVKELRTLYSVQRELTASDRPLESRLSRVVELLPGGWLHPERTEARLVLEDRSWTTPGFREGGQVLRATIRGSRGPVGRVEVTLRDPSGEVVDPFLGEEHELLEAVAAAVGEATERDRLREDFIQAQKMETVGRLAGGVAHDFNNLMTVIRGHAELIGDTLSDEDELLRTDLAQIVRAVDRGSELSGQLLSFSRKQLLREETVDLTRALEAIRPMLTRLVPARIRLELLLPPSPTPVRLDPARLDQTVMNLVVNAVHAIEGEGTIRIGLDREVHAPHLAPSSVPTLHLWVSDDGEGMTSAVAGRVFEPFFTTKPTGSGTGLGLSMVYGFIRQSEGWIDVESAPGEGTTLHLYLPEADAPEEESQRPLSNSDSEVSPRTVLLVEDHDPVRSVLRRILVRKGHTVLEARGGEEALEVIRRHPEPIHLTLTDVVMPGMGGAGLVERLRAQHPEIRVILMSGYSEDEVTPEIRAHASDFLSKPFSREDVARAIRNSLG